MKLLLADDHTLFREGFSMIISSTVIEAEVFPADNWNEAISLVKEHPFDIALLDLFMPGNMSWQEELSAFISCAPNVPVCIVSSSNNQSHINQAFKLGVKAYIRKTSGASEVKKALSSVIKGGRYLDWKNAPQAIETANLSLTRREKEILMLIADGNSNKQIGIQLDITESTVKRHVYNLFKALGAKSRIDAIQIAKNQNLLTNQ